MFFGSKTRGLALRQLNLEHLELVAEILDATSDCQQANKDHLWTKPLVIYYFGQVVLLFIVVVDWLRPQVMWTYNVTQHITVNYND